jgi:Fe-S-cluster containining protein
MDIREHQLDEDGEHDSDACEVCFEAEHSVTCECRCGNCCERLLIEVSVRDALREPRIKVCGPIYDDNFGQGPKDLIGYMLNDRDNDFACRFFDRETRRCIIHDTRPLICRVFNCDEEANERWPEGLEPLQSKQA